MKGKGEKSVNNSEENKNLEVMYDVVLLCLVYDSVVCIWSMYSMSIYE